MNYINNFRYGEISRKNAGRFDREGYQQGAFSFINAKTGYLGDAQRRPPLKKLIDTTGVLRLVTFIVSEELSYTIALKESVLEVYRFVVGKYTKITEIGYPKADEDEQLKMTAIMAREVRYAQYYTRMYFVHQDFRPFFIEINPSNDSVSTSVVSVILNQKALGTLYFTPQYVANDNGEEVTSQEGRLVYYNEDGIAYKWFFDEEFTDPYEYAYSYPPILGDRSQIGNYDNFQEDDFLNGSGNFPAGVACINERLFFYATKNHPQAFWMSRTLGSSQWIDGFTTDSMHDLINFQVVTSETPDIVDELPMTAMTDSSGNIIYEQENGQDKYFTSEKDEDGNYTYAHRIYWKPKEPNSEEKVWYDEYGEEYTLKEGEPVRKPYMVIDVTRTDAFTKYNVSVDLITNDSCGGRYELNTGRQDRVMAIAPGCERIFVLTTTSEHYLPDDFNASSNLSRKKFSDYTSVSSYAVTPLTLNNSFLFVQRGNILREFYVFEGYLNNSDVTVLNHDILDSDIISCVSKNTPDPMCYFALSDGTIRALTYDKSNEIQSFSRWTFGNRQIISLATIEVNNENRLIALVKSETEEFIGYFDEHETEHFIDEGGVSYTTEITTPYLEIVSINNSEQVLSFGRTKQVHSAFLRCLNTGKIVIVDRSGQENVTNYRLDEESDITDYRIPIDGRASSQYQLTIRSYEDHPMDILALAYEVT